MSIQSTEQELDALRRKRNEMTLAEQMARLDMAEEILILERKLAALHGHAYAVPWTWPQPWDWATIGLQAPLLIADGLRATLVYTTPAPGGTRGSKHLAFVEFSGCKAAYLGSPNDEVIFGHPLYGKGIDVGGAYTIQNSSWKSELAEINSVHSQFDSSYWEALTHYLLFFKDCTFECVASKYTSSVRPESLNDNAFAAFRLLVTALKHGHDG